jgi:hypothetical protein
MIRWLQGLWYARLRKIDMDVLWPTCAAQAHDLDHAKAAFAVHAFNDPAWQFLGEDATRRFIDDLEVTPNT